MNLWNRNDAPRALRFAGFRLDFESVGQLTAITGIIVAGFFGLWMGFYDINLGGLQANALMTDSNDLLDPFVGLDFNYLEGTS